MLVTGPTGSGKTTTLYAALSRLPRGSVNMMTVEDPIEYALDGVAQTQVNPRIELDFARALRAILRQDPDVIMIGEIRDLETAQIAVQASLTGHLVLATLHTNDAASAVTRLADMGVEPYLLVVEPARRARAAAGAHALPGLPARESLPRRASASCLRASGLPALTSLYEPRGCDACNDTGYRGRTGVYELHRRRRSAAPLDPRPRAARPRCATPRARAGMTTLRARRRALARRRHDVARRAGARHARLVRHQASSCRHSATRRSTRRDG